MQQMTKKWEGELAQTWRQLLDAALTRHEHQPHSRFVSLATVRADGRPANRTVTFRSFISGNRLLFTSDARAEKVLQLKAQPSAELCWYFHESRQQFRLTGKIQMCPLLDDQEIVQARERIWLERSEQFRQSFTWPAPGKERDADAAFCAQAPSTPPDNFTVLVLQPTSVDVLDLRPVPHERRFFWTEAGNWKAALSNP